MQNGAMAFGGTIVLQPRFQARAALELMVVHGVTFFDGVPTMYWGLLGALDETVDVASLTRILCVTVAGGSALPTKIQKEFEGRFGVTILEGCGLSKTSPVAPFSTYREQPASGRSGSRSPVRDEARQRGLA